MVARRSRRNIAARAAATSAAGWKRAAFGWLAFAVAAMALGTAVGTKPMAATDAASGEAARAERILSAAGFARPATESVLVQSRTGSQARSDSEFIAAIAQVVQMLSLQPDVKNISNPLEQPASQISRDGRSALVQFDVRGKLDDAKEKIQPILDTVAGLERANPGFRIEEFGQASANHVIGKTLEEDFARAEQLSLPITLLVLLFAFGALVAAGLPVILAFSAVLASMGLSAFLSHLVPAADATKSIILLVGMAVGVDYSLFYLRREREERAAGREPHRALIRAAATSGQAVLVSGTTVLIAMAGMLFAGNHIFTSIAIGTMTVVFVAMVGSLTVLPALLHRFGDAVEKGRIPFARGFRRPASDSRLWGAILRPVLRWPAAAALLSGGLLLALATPVLSIHTKLPSFTDLPHSLAIVRTYDRIQHSFAGSQTPVVVVVKAPNVTTPAFRRAYVDFRRRALATGQLFQPFHVVVSPDRTVARIELAIAGDGDNGTSVRALSALRSDVIPPVAATLPEAEVAVTGETAGTHDFNEMMKERAPLVIGFVLALAFVLLLITFRSIVVPIKAILLNLLSVGAAYGILILVFQQGHLEGVLGYTSNGAIASWLPLFLFVILFGLSMDYHVFILSRVKELVDRGLSTEEAVERGIRSTAGTVTAAALVMVGVFAIFVTLRQIDIKQMGFGLAVAILLDATIVRAVLLPSTMKLLGEWNWYLPHWLEWLPGGGEPRGPASGAGSDGGGLEQPELVRLPGRLRA
jgi:RND superfamily putative drug exporter